MHARLLELGIHLVPQSILVIENTSVLFCVIVFILVRGEKIGLI